MECAPKHSIIKVATFSALMESWDRRTGGQQRVLTDRDAVRGSHDPELREKIQNKCLLALTILILNLTPDIPSI